MAARSSVTAAPTRSMSSTPSRSMPDRTNTHDEYVRSDTRCPLPRRQRLEQGSVIPPCTISDMKHSQPIRPLKVSTLSRYDPRVIATSQGTGPRGQLLARALKEKRKVLYVQPCVVCTLLVNVTLASWRSDLKGQCVVGAEENNILNFDQHILKNKVILVKMCRSK